MANQIMTTVEAHVPAERWAELSERAAQMQAQRPPQIIQSYLLHSATNGNSSFRRRYWWSVSLCRCPLRSD